MLLLVPAAFAADPSPAVILPSAVPVAKGSGEVSLAAAHAASSLLTLWGAGARLHVGYAPVDRVWIAASGAVVYWEDTSCGLDSCSDTVTGVAGPFSLQARYNVTERPEGAFGPVVGVIVDPGGERGALGAGLAFETGGRRTRFDLTLVGAATLIDGEVALAPAPIGELGLSFLIGSESLHRLRVGLVEVAPDVSWRYEDEVERWFVEVGVTGIPVGYGAERVELGLRF